jgi:hypothetical protein
MSGFVIRGALSVSTLPKALFANLESVNQFVIDREAYETAVATFEEEASPETLRAGVALARRHRLGMTMADAREHAVSALRESLRALGYDDEAIEWHAARRGRRDRTLFAASLPAFYSVLKESPQAGRWRGSYTKRRSARAH